MYKNEGMSLMLWATIRGKIKFIQLQSGGTKHLAEDHLYIIILNSWQQVYEES